MRNDNNLLSVIRPIFLLVFTSAVFAQHHTLTIAPDASEAKITLKTNHEIVNGSFHVQSGTIDYDRSAPTLSGVVVVAAGSGKTGNDSRDKKMNKDVLKAPEFAAISFSPKSYSGTIATSGDSTIQVSGTFTLLGTPHDVTLPMQIHIEGEASTVKSHFIIPYVQWGLKNPSFLVWKAESDVAVDLLLVGKISK